MDMITSFPHLGWSFQGACAAREPGIHTPGAVVMDSGFAAAAIRNDANNLK
jgi:hypothetical protein